MSNHNYITHFKRGFTLVEMAIIAPIVILVIGIFISAIITMTGSVLASRGATALAYNIQSALNTIDQDVRSSNGYLATNSITLTSPQGYNDDTTNFHNADPTNGTMLILNTSATTTNPSSSTRSFVYAANQPNACSSQLVSSNATVSMNIVYFVKNNSLWRRIIAPANYATIGCSVPWQRPSCTPGSTASFCVTQDSDLVDGVASSGFNVNYYTSSNPTTPITNASNSSLSDAVRQTAINTASSIGVTINATATFAGRSISQNGTIRTTENSQLSIVAIGAIAGNTIVGSTLTAGALTPSGATATYQWQSSTTAGGIYTNIAGATSNTYTVAVGDVGNYVRVVATGIGSYSSSATSASVYIHSGLLTALSPATIATGIYPCDITISTDGSSVYVTNYGSNTISMYSRNTTTGQLTALSPATIAAGTNPFGITISADGSSVYATNNGSNTISMYSRNTTTGLLTALSPATIATGTIPDDITVSTDGNSVYAINDNSATISMYSRNTTTGLLTALSPATIATGTNPNGTTISADGSSVYVANISSNTISMYSRNTTTGLLTALSPATIATGTSPEDITISADGSSVYVTNYSSATISMYSRNTTTGLLTALSPATIATGTSPEDITISADGSSVYVTNYSSATISMYSRNTTTGLLTALSPAAIATGTSPYYIAISADGSSVYVTNYSSATISMYSRKP